MIMNNLTIGTQILNGFLRLMVGILVCILVGVVVILGMAAIGFFD